MDAVAGSPAVRRGGLDGEPEVSSSALAGGALQLTSVLDEHAPAPHAVWSVGRPRMRNSMYVLQASGLNILHMGDNRAQIPAEVVRRLGSIDVLLLTVDDCCHLLTFDEIDALLGTLRPRLIIPMHYAIGGLTHGSAIEPAGTFGGRGLGRLEEWLLQREQRGGVVRRMPGEVSLAELQEAVAGAATKPEVWVMDVFGAEMLCKPCGQRM